MAQPGFDWPIWITAGATALTAILTGTGGMAAWLALRRERRREMPVVERTFSWIDDHISVGLVVRNRLPESLILDSITVRHPRGATVSSQHGKAVNAYGEPGLPEPGDGPVMHCGYSVSPLGTQRGQVTAGDSAAWGFALWPPSGWRGGKVVIVLRISSKAETIRNRTIVIRSRVFAALKKQ